MSTTAKKRPKLEPLDIKCTSTDCAAGLHCFRATKKMAANNEQGACRKCKAKLVDWDRVKARDANDAAYTFKMLQAERIRHHFWHKEFDEKALLHARRKGKSGMRAAAVRRIRSSVGTKTAFDGRQTPKEGNVLFYAQHATGSCCRKCIEEWHGIPQDQPLDDAQVKYLSDLCYLFVEKRLPTLAEAGEKIPQAKTSAPAVPKKG